MPRSIFAHEMLEKLLLPDIREHLEAGELDTLAEILNDWPAPDIAALLEDLPENERPVILGVLKLQLRVQAFEHLALESQIELVRSMNRESAAEILNDMSPDDRTALLEELPEVEAQEVLKLLTPAERQVAESLLHYPPESVGRLMTPDYLEVKPEWTMKRVLDHVRAHGHDSETLYNVYVTDDHGKLIDDVRIRDVLLSPLPMHVRDVMDHKFVSLSADDDRRSAVDVFRKYDRTSLPVVDQHGKLVGIVTIDDVIDVAEEEATRDLQRFGGVEALDEAYVETGLLTLLRKRATWLIVLFLGETLTTFVMGAYEDSLQRAAVLMMFVPLLISSGGNSGSQAATLLIRALAVKEISLRDWFWVFRREVLSGFLLGLILGSIGFLKIAVGSQFSDAYGPHAMLVALTVALSLVWIVMSGTLTGAMLPFILKSLKLDPATSSAPFVATMVDVTGLIIYFTVASIVLRGTLL